MTRRRSSGRSARGAYGRVGTERGKIELTAEADGLLKIDREKLNAVNGMGQIVIASRHGDFL